MNTGRGTTRPQRRGGIALAFGFLALCAVAAAIAVPNLRAPGLYYDEVIQAEPAVEFLAKDGTPLQIPGARSVWLCGRWFPVMTQAYMGALKSQALIPVFALFGPTPESLRLATLSFALLGLLFALLWARLALGLPVALVAGALLAVDPSFLFTSRHDWGSFALGFLCRCGGVYFVTSGFRRGSRGHLFAGGLLCGLGVYNKIDFAVFLAAAGAALALSAPRALLTGLRAPPRPVLPALLGFALGAAPVMAGLGGVLSALRVFVAGRHVGSVGLREKAETIFTMLDGSHFQRLMLAGGSFDDVMRVEGATWGPFPLIFLASALFVGLRLLRGAMRGDWDRAHAFVLLTSFFVLLGTLLTPRAARIHHALNVYPFPQLLVAIALVTLWRSRGAARRTAAVLATAAALAGSLNADFATLRTIRETGGKGRWSDALMGLARELQGRPDTAVVSLDWGTRSPLRFVARDLEVDEPIWRLRRPAAPGGGWTFSGSPRHVYLVYPEAYAVFHYGGAFLEAVRRLPPGTVSIRTHEDRSGDPALISVRFARDHQLVYRSGGFEVRLR
ncbi:MAG: glycosyltransferase family 39 protein [Myxococcota bacterium]